MKLHLPSRLRSALLACMALISPIAPSVSGVAFTAGVAAFTLLQAEATEIQMTLPGSGEKSFISGGSIDGNRPFAGESNHTVTKVQSIINVIGAVSSKWYYGVAQGANDSDVKNNDVSISGNTLDFYARGGYGGEWIIASMEALNGTDKLTFSFTSTKQKIAYSVFVYYADTGLARLYPDATDTTKASIAETNVKQEFSLSELDLGAGDYIMLSFGANYTKGPSAKNPEQVTGITVKANLTGYTEWKGGDGTWDTTTQNWTQNGADSVFTSNDKVLFASGTGTVSINEDTVTSDFVCGGNYTFSIAEGKTLSLGKTTLGVGGVATITGAGSVRADVDDALKLTIDTGWTGVVTISGGQKGIDLAKLVNGSISTLECNGITGWSNNTTPLNNSDTSQSWKGNNTYNVKLTDNGSNKAWVNGAYSTQSIETCEFSGKWSGSGTFVASVGAGRMHYTYSGDVSQWTGAFEKTGSGATTLTFTGAAGSVNATVLRSVGNLAVIADVNATFSKSVTADTFTVNADKTAIFSGAGQDYNIGTVAGSGTLKVTDGTLCLATLSGNLTFAGGGYKGGTITVGDSATLTIDGTVKVASLAQLTASGSTIPTGNGYVTATYTLATGEESTISATGAKAVVGGVECALAHSSDSKALTFSTDGSSGTYYVNTGSVNYDNAANATTDPPYTVDIDAGKTTGIVLNGDDVTLNMHLSLSSVAADKISVKNNSTINLAKSDVVLNKSDVSVDSGKSLTLTGSGNYVIASPGAKITLGTRVQLGADWEGTVTISGGTGGNYFANLVNDTKSTLEFNGVTGWESNLWRGTNAYNVKLTNAGSTEAWVNGAFTDSVTDNTATFSGIWSGDGTFVAYIDNQKKNGNPRYMNYTYTGDIKDWTGRFEFKCKDADVPYACTLTFSDDAKNVNIDILRSSDDCTLAVVADTDATFSKSVTADAVTVNAGKSAVFKGTLTTTTLTANAETTLSGTGSVIGTLAGTRKMLVSGGTTEVTNALSDGTAVEVTDGTLTLAGGTAEGSGSVTVKDGGTLSLKGGADAAVETSFATGTVTLEKGGVLTCSGKAALTGAVTGSGTLDVVGGSELTVSGTVSLGATITNAGKLSLGTGGSLSFSSLAELDSKGTSYYDTVMESESVNGYESGTYYIVKGSGTIGSLTTVSVDGTNFDVTVEGGDASIINSGKGGLYYINTGTVNYGKSDDNNAADSEDTTGLVLKDGTLNMYSSLNEKAERGIIVAGKASILLCEGGSLEDVALTVEKKDGVQLKLQSSDGGSVTLKQLTGEGELVEGSDVVVKEGGSFTGTYSGAVRFGTAADGALQKLCADDNLTVIGTAGTVEVTGLTNPDTPNFLAGIATTGSSVRLDNKTDAGAPTKVTLVNASSMNGGETGCELEFTVSAAQVNANLAAAKADKPTVTTGAKLDLSNVTLKVNEVDNTGFAYNTDGPEKDIILFVVSDKADSTVDNVKVDMSDCTWMTKYFTNFRVVQGSINVVADANTSRYAVYGQTPNGTAGLALAGKAMFHLDPQTQNPDGELAQVLDMLDNHIASGNSGAMDKLGAALAGSSLSAVGLALADDVQRQLRSIRNRTTTMGVNECVVNEDMPYVNGWISGDGNYRQLSESGTDAGYQLSSWGGTVGVDVDVNPNLTLGVAVSALFGDYTGKAADTLTGDLDTQYVSLFARVSTGSWVNTFVGTLGRADVDLERTIPGVTGKTTYKTDGMMFGFLYEVARTFALNEDASTCVQPLFNMSFSHTSLDSATEGGTADTRLTTDSASLTQFSLGLGGRLQSIVGENEYNRASIFEARALLKLDLGDRYSKLNTALAALPTATVTTRSNESGVIGAEVGASLTIPISQDAGSVFFDVNADFRADQTGVNGSVGYRINF